MRVNYCSTNRYTMKKGKNKKSTLPDLSKQSILVPIDLESIGTNNDPCFGKAYDLTTKECKICGDSELCCIKFAALMGKTRKELESENAYKDLETLVDIQAVKKTIRNCKRNGEEKKVILEKIERKYEISHQQARAIYKEVSTKKS